MFLTLEAITHRFNRGKRIAGHGFKVFFPHPRAPLYLDSDSRIVPTGRWLTMRGKHRDIVPAYIGASCYYWDGFHVFVNGIDAVKVAALYSNANAQVVCVRYRDGYLKGIRTLSKDSVMPIIVATEMYVPKIRKQTNPEGA